MIDFIYKTDFLIDDRKRYTQWISEIIRSEGKELGEISYTFCDDIELDKMNREYLNHTDLTDIISFDFTVGDIISGDIFISVDRVKENADIFEVDFREEMLRVMAHGLLHYCGYKDHTEDESAEMRKKEEEKIELFHVEQFKNKSEE